MRKKFTHRDLEDLEAARQVLENPSPIARISNQIGRPIEKGIALLPADWSEKVAKATRAALMKGLEFAVMTMGNNKVQESRDLRHKLMVTATGMAGGAFGLVALPLELPVSTCLILRSVADIARSEGHDITSLKTRLSCLEVLALGGPTGKDDAAESGYWAIRAATAKAISEAASYIAEKGLAEKGAPPLARFIVAISSRFGAVVGEEVAAKAVPIIGAASGALINLAFMDHFQDMARGHFAIKRLERVYGIRAVQRKYEEIG
jgi:hypothetical protein